MSCKTKPSFVFAFVVVAALLAIILCLWSAPAQAAFEEGKCFCDSTFCYFFCEDPFPRYLIDDDGKGNLAQCVALRPGVKCDANSCKCLPENGDCYCCTKPNPQALKCEDAQFRRTITYCCKDVLTPGG